MNGKKIVIYFVIVTAVTGVFLSLWIKEGYDSRPDIKIKEEKK